MGWGEEEGGGGRSGGQIGNTEGKQSVLRFSVALRPQRRCRIITVRDRGARDVHLFLHTQLLSPE